MPLPLKILLLALALPCACFAWGGMGHQVVALIADERLTPAAQKGITELLGTDKIYDAEIASWADNERREQRKTAPWHYVDIPADADAYDAKRDGRKGANVIDKISDFEKILADKTKSKDERAEALKYLVHFVGDVHQPLHCCERDNDSGGNKVPVQFLDRKEPSNLHKVWDTDLLNVYVGRTRVAEYSLKLSKGIKAADAKKWAEGTPTDWANETHKVAVDSVYKDVPAKGTTYDAKTVEAKRPAVELQLQRGGIRLAFLLNESFKNH